MDVLLSAYASETDADVCAPVVVLVRIPVGVTWVSVLNPFRAECWDPESMSQAPLRLNPALGRPALSRGRQQPTLQIAKLAFARIVGTRQFSQVIRVKQTWA